MYSNAKTCVMFLLSGKYTWRYYENVKTLFGSQLSQNIENQPKTSLQDIVVMLHFHQKERGGATACYPLDTV